MGLEEDGPGSDHFLASKPQRQVGILGLGEERKSSGWEEGFKPKQGKQAVSG